VLWVLVNQACDRTAKPTSNSVHDLFLQEATEKIVDEWQSATSNYRHTRSDTTGRSGTKARRRTPAGTGTAAAAGAAATDKTPRWTYAQQSPLDFPLSAVEILSDMKAMHIDWKVRAVRFAMHPNRPRYPVEVKRDPTAAARATSAAVPTGAAAGNVLHYCGEILRPGDDVRVIATLTADEFVCRLLRVTHAEVILGLPDGSKSRVPTVHLVNGRFTIARLAVPHLPPRPEGMADPPSPPGHANLAAQPLAVPTNLGYTNSAPRSSASMHALMRDDLPSIAVSTAAQAQAIAPPQARARAPSYASQASAAGSAAAPAPQPSAGGTKRARGSPALGPASTAGHPPTADQAPPTQPAGHSSSAAMQQPPPAAQQQHFPQVDGEGGDSSAKRPRTAAAEQAFTDAAPSQDSHSL